MDDLKKQKPDPEVQAGHPGMRVTKLEPPEMLAAFQQFLGRLRDYLLPILGEATVDAIFRNAIRENVKRYKFLASSTINAAEISFPMEGEARTVIEPGELFYCMLDFMQSIITLLTELTGDVLTRKVELLMADVNTVMTDGEQ